MALGLAGEEDALGRDELEAVFDTLADREFSDPEEALPRADATPLSVPDTQASGAGSGRVVEQRARIQVPRMPRHTQFPDLFKPLPGPQAFASAGVDAKIELLRERLKAAEGQIAAFRDAWEIRERELDALEQLVMRERSHSTELSDNLQTLQSFIQKKKEEFERYGEGVKAAFAEREDVERELRRRVDELEKASSEQQQQVGVRNAAIKKLKAAIEELRVRLTDREEEAESLRAELQGRDAQLRGWRAQIDRHDAELQTLRERLHEQKQEAKLLKRALRAAEADKEETARRLEVEEIENERLKMALQAERARGSGKGKRRY